jgi:hypothetical protein
VPPPPGEGKRAHDRIDFSNSDMTPHSRGAHAPGLLRNPHSLDEEGAGNAGCSAAPAASYAKQKSIRAYVTTGTPRHSGIPRAMVLTVSFEFSPETGLFCLRHPREASASQELDISVGISGPHDFAVRGQRHPSSDAATSIASRANVRDDREAPLSAGAGW